MTNSFTALVASKADAEQQADFQELSLDDLDEGDVTVAIEYSTLNYKDGLAITGSAPIVQRFPLILGIDFAGRVIASERTDFEVGDRVVLNGFGASERLHGGYANFARLSGDLLVKLPSSIDSKAAMAIGTAGYTAMLCVLALEDGGVLPEKGPILVTGAAGGVGTVAISLLSKLGYRVEASTGRLSEESFLKSLGAQEVHARDSWSAPGKPMQREAWAGVVDCVGSNTLANALAQTCYGGAVAACGLAQGADLPTTVMPFILRGVSLLGIDSVQAPGERRRQAWERLATDLDLATLNDLSFSLEFSQLPSAAWEILAGNIRGRAVVEIPAS
ncbi:MAG: MDR family oxidoreductase [Pseudomonadota bacterium]